MSNHLEGIRVVELGTHVAVPKAARIMADWGAEVIKVEPPGGEPWRYVGPGATRCRPGQTTTPSSRWRTSTKRVCGPEFENPPRARPP